MRLNISHTTTYRYGGPVDYGLEQLRLTPKSSDFQNVLSWKIDIEGGAKQVEFDDQHMNHVTLITLSDGNDTFRVTCSGEIETKDTSGVVGRHNGFAPLWYFTTATDLTRAGNQTRKLCKGLITDYPDELDRLHALTDRVLGAVRYETGMTHSATTAEDALTAGQGVCQDHAHIFIAAARSMDIPARYASGYLLMDDRVEQDASHAWAEAYVTGIGWIGFDVSNQICPDERYIRVATGLDYREAAPVSGMRIGNDSEELLEVSIQVQQ